MNRTLIPSIVAVVALIVAVIALAGVYTADREATDREATDREIADTTVISAQERDLFVEIYHLDSWARPAGVDAGLPAPDARDAFADTRIASTYFFRPNSLVVFEGDTVTLTVMNNAGHRIHSLAIPELEVNTGPIAPRMDRVSGGAFAGETVTVNFVAGEAGTYRFRCAVPHIYEGHSLWQSDRFWLDEWDYPEGWGPDDLNGCSPDHAYQYGYLSVLAR